MDTCEMSERIWQDDQETGIADAHEEGLLLMSMALDGLLSAEEEARFLSLIAEDDAMDASWKQWQKVDALLEQMPRAVPAGDFVARFEMRLDKKERWAGVRQRLGLAALAVLGWVGAAVVVIAAGWYIWANQTQWMSGFVRELVYYPSAVSIGLRAAQSTLSATVSEPQSIAVVCSYVAAGALLLAAWLWFLKRTTREEVVS